MDTIAELIPRATIELRLHAYPALRVDALAVALTLKHGLALLARLVDADGRFSRASAAALLWPDAGEALGRTRLRRLVHELNRRVGVGLITGDGDALWLDERTVLSCDWLQARRLARSALRGESLKHGLAAPLLERQSDRVLDGFALDSDTFTDWLEASRHEHTALVARALQQLALRWLEEGELVASTAAAERLIQIDRCAEAGYACLIAVRAALGDSAGVESVYCACADALRHEFGIKPSTVLERAYADAVARCAQPATDQALTALLARAMSSRLSQGTPRGRVPATMPP